jgi:hypothetical protein
LVLLALKSELPKHARDGFFVFGARGCFASNDQYIPLSVRPLRLLSFFRRPSSCCSFLLFLVAHLRQIPSVGGLRRSPTLRLEWGAAGWPSLMSMPPLTD